MSLMLGVFILGVLAGWILEWLIVLLFIPNPKQRLEKTLETSRQEIARLQSRIRELETKPAATSGSNESQVAEVPAEPVAEAASEIETGDVATPEAEPQTEVAAEPAETSEVEPEPVSDAETLEPDDLTKLGGIGPKLAEAMQAAGITRFAQIAEMGGDEVGKRLSENGVRYTKAAAETWSEQAKLAAQGDWKGLKAYQESLKA